MIISGILGVGLLLFDNFLPGLILLGAAVLFCLTSVGSAIVVNCCAEVNSEKSTSKLVTSIKLATADAEDAEPDIESAKSTIFPASPQV